MSDVVNFGAGPAGLPRPALERAQRELLDFEGTGISIMEHSHRSETYDRVHNRALELVRSLLEVPDDYSVFFVQGGASGMFATVPMNFLPPQGVADYVLTGIWSKKALAEAQLLGNARVAATTEVDGRWYRVPELDELSFSPDAAYVHFTTNSTISGVQWPSLPPTTAPVVADASSDLFARPYDVSHFGMLYAGAQKNLGPSGVTLGVVKTSWLESASSRIPKIFRYAAHVEANSLLHTPPTFAIYLVKNVLEWLVEQGGVHGIGERNAAKARLLYEAIDGSDGWYRTAVEVVHRSTVNVVFACPTPELDARFVAEATEAGLIGLKGHRSVGGLRASLYNAVTLDGVARLVAFMNEFKREHG